MATKSIMKNIDIRTRSLGNRLVGAMEQAETAAKKKKTIDVPVEHIRKEQVEDFLRSL